MLVAGPIERATHLLPQLKVNRDFSYAQGVDGLRQILWGLFKKVVIADTCASIVDDIFASYTDYPGSTLAIGAILFAFQIYGDFSGYSDIALGTAKLFGIDLLRNFSYPYFSRDIAEFWRRWHISLSSWFRDYVYIPLGGSHGSLLKKFRNTLIVFLLSGFWHGANWTFLAWGLLNAVYIMPSILSGTNRRHLNIVASDRQLPNYSQFLRILFTFCLTTIAWIFFRSPTIDQALSYIKKIFSFSIMHFPNGVDNHRFYILVLLLSFQITLEWFNRTRSYPMEHGLFENRVLRYTLYTTLSVLVPLYYGSNQVFIYFQF